MKKTIWILLDNRVGSRHQAEGIENYLDKSLFNIEHKEIEYTKWGALPNFIRGCTLIGVTEKTKESLKTNLPDFVISSSRRTAPVARWLKKQSPQTKLFQLMHIGRFGVKDFTKIYVPEHDKGKFFAPNISYTTGSPHFITKQKLDEAYNLWHDEFAHLPHPITALIIGGAIKKKPFTLANAAELAKNVCRLKEKEGGSLLITTSRRTGAEAEREIMSYLNKIPHYAYLWGNKSQNPYFGFLACADDIIVTGDSVSMCCEATGTQKPLRIFTGKDWLTKKHLRFVNSLYDKKIATDINSETTATGTSTLNVAQNIAEEINSLANI